MESGGRRGSKMSRLETTTSRGSGRSGPRASLACMNCRQRKIKCRMSDPHAAACQSCRSLNLSCVINKDGDRAGSRQHVAALQERLDFLESYIASEQRSNSISQPGNAAESRTIGSPSMFLPDSGSQISPTSFHAHRPSFDASSRIGNDFPLPAEGMPGSQGSQAGPGASLSILDPKSQSHFDNYSSSSHQADLGRLTPSTDKDSNRLDVDETDGQPRFYGPTSQAHIQRHSVPIESEEVTTDDEGLNIDSAPLQALLFNTYWKIQPHSVVIVDNALFFQGRESGRRSEYYSSFLEDSLLASATRMSTSSGVRALGPRYVDRAKAAIAHELERPNTATLQAFLLLSDFEATRGRDRLGYLYCGIGCRLVFDLGLHESCADLVAKGKLSNQEAMSRHTLLLGSFVYDKLWSLYTGRPGSIPIATMEAAHHKALASFWEGPPTLDSWVRLCADMSDATDILNRTSPLDFAAREHLINLDRRIQGRSETLPPELILHRDRVSELPPSAYSLHIQFHGIRIILHRLLYKTAHHQAIESPSDLDHQNFSIERSRAIMYENAIQIAQLVSVYQQIFGVEQVITIMLDNSYVAAIVLISHVLRALQHDPASATVERDMQRLRTLADLLSRAQKHYPVTVRMRFSLSSHVDNTPIAGMFGTFAQTSHEPKNATVTEVQPNSNGQQTLTEVPADIFSDFSILRPDMALFEDWGGDTGQSIFQEMDMQNMMSWALSPSSARADFPLQ